MSDSNLPLSERKRLKQKMLTKHHLANILTHWFNAASWAFLLATGLAILGQRVYQPLPAAWSELLRNLFGGLAPLIKWHESWGIVWAFVILFNVTLGFRQYFLPFGARRMMLDRDDLQWFKQYGRNLLGLCYQLPDQDDYNAGQKVFSYVVVLGIMAIISSGLIMTFSHLVPLSLRWLVQWAMPVHFTAVGLVVAGLVIHIYMGAIFPEERPAFFSMFSGKVHALYAYSHHRKWYERYIAAERAWEVEQLAHEAVVTGEATEQNNTLDELMAEPHRW
jgi:formate dehydrogenase subunit gamma